MIRTVNTTSITLDEELSNDLWFIRNSGLLPEDKTGSWNAFLEYLADQTITKLGLKERLQAMIDSPNQQTNINQAIIEGRE